MEDKRKDQKPGILSNQEYRTNDEPQSKQENAPPNVVVGPTAKISSPSPSYHNVPNSNQPPIVQWPYAPQNATEHWLALHFPTQASQHIALNQWQQLPYPQVYAQSASFSPTIFQPFADTGFQGGTSSVTQTLLPNMFYHYRFPGVPCSWGPSSYMAQLYQMQHPYVVNRFPVAPNFTSTTPKVSDCLASGEHSSQREIWRPPLKHSQKHQQLWEGQKTENGQLWSLINKLQVEVSDYKDRLKKLEEEVSSFKQKEVPSNEVIGTIPVGITQPKKRGRPNKSLASVDALYESHLQAGVKKPALSNRLAQSVSPLGKVKTPIFEKVILKKVENKELTTRSITTMMQRESNVNILNVSKGESCNTRINQSNPPMPACQGQVHREYQGIQSGNGVDVNFGKKKELKLVERELSQPDEVLNNSDTGVSGKYIVGNTGNGNVGLTSGIVSSEGTAKDVLDINRQSFLHNGNFIQQGGNITSGWSLGFANQEEASEDAMEGSIKDESEVTGDDTSSAVEEIGVTKYQGGWLEHE
ncbi:hypothetical protein VNO78_08027 [Psophocarpus tetragonolobus]|uniref:Uncharacterized protein n=1 Tax=Psophocarpus tetragonolobus TaxID=3891 RepID=A0AAN9XSL1_PSOTE